MKLTSYAEIENPDPENSYTVTAIQNTANYKTKLSTYPNLSKSARMMTYACDFFGSLAAQFSPFEVYLGAFPGTVSAYPAVAGHPGIVEIVGGGMPVYISAIGVNQTALNLTNVASDCVFNATTLTGAFPFYHICGGVNILFSAVPLGTGPHFDISVAGGGVTTWPAAINTWYRSHIEITASMAYISIYDMTGSILGTVSSAYNPVGNQEFYMRVGDGTHILLDYLSYYDNSDLVR